MVVVIHFRVSATVIFTERWVLFNCFAILLHWVSELTFRCKFVFFEHTSMAMPLPVPFFIPRQAAF